MKQVCAYEAIISSVTLLSHGNMPSYRMMYRTASKDVRTRLGAGKHKILWSSFGHDDKRAKFAETLEGAHEKVSHKSMLRKLSVAAFPNNGFDEAVRIHAA